MALSIKNDEVEKLARELAGRRRVSITEAIRQSLKREVKRENLVRDAIEEGSSDRFKALMEIAERAASLPDVSNLSEDEILGYDEFGVPELPKEMR